MSQNLNNAVAVMGRARWLCIKPDDRCDCQLKVGSARIKKRKPLRPTARAPSARWSSQIAMQLLLPSRRRSLGVIGFEP